MKNIYTLKTNSPQQTHNIGKQLAQQLTQPIQIALKGTLGAGKTVFVQGLADGLNIKEIITSPTYVLIKSYQGRLPLHHCDWYRLSSDSDIESTGHEDLPPGIIAMEWADKFPEIMEQPYIDIQINATHHNQREIQIEIVGDAQLKESLKEAIQ